MLKYLHNHLRMEIFCPIWMLYNILLLINHYIGNSTTKHHSRSMSDNRDLTEIFNQKISSHLCAVRNYIQKKADVCIIYGIVIIEIYSCNKELYTFKVAWFSLLYHLSTQRLENPKTSIVYCSAPIYIYM